MNLLADILAYKRNEELPRTVREVPLAGLRARAMLAAPVRDLAAALAPAPGGRPRLIGLIQRAAPGRGVIVRGRFDPAELARTLAAAGAAALAVHTDARYAQGSLAQLVAARAATALPVIRVDFLIDGYQLVEARAHGADGVMLLAAALSRNALRELLAAAGELRLLPIVAAHSAEELRLALDAGAEWLALLQREPRSFAVEAGAAARLRPLVPEGVPSIAWGGIRSAADVEALRPAGFRAVVAGEALMRAQPERRAALARELAGG
jgi:indole-3-glycerol phosphate synthase